MTEEQQATGDQATMDSNMALIMENVQKSLPDGPEYVIGAMIKGIVGTYFAAGLQPKEFREFAEVVHRDLVRQAEKYVGIAMMISAEETESDEQEDT